MKTYYKKYFLFSWVFLVFSSVVSNATVIEPSPANSIKRFLERSLFLLIVIVSVFLIVSILKMLFSKNFDLIKRLKIKVFRGVRFLSIILVLFVFIELFYCNFMVLLLGKDHKFFKMSLLSCNYFTGCPDVSGIFQCD